jgi:hypothetical protein
MLPGERATPNSNHIPDGTIDFAPIFINMMRVILRMY